MASKGEDQLDSLLSRICKDPLEKRKFKRDVDDILTKVDIPNDWEEGDTEYKLHEKNPTYQFRYSCLEAFIKKKEAECFSITRKTDKEFFQELRSYFLENDSCLESRHSESPPFNIFQENVKIHGVVLRKSAKFKKAFVLVKQKRYAIESELVLDIRGEEHLASWSQFKVGDIVEVTKCRRKEGIALEPEVIRCYSRSEDEIVSFLEHLKSCIQTDGSTAAVIEIERCHAVWNYTIELAEERFDDQVICYILQITDSICSKAQRQMSHTLVGILKSIEESTFFTSALLNFVNKLIKEKTDSENCNLVRRFLEHMLNISPSCGRRVFSMATLLAKHLVTTSQDHESAKESGQRAVDFLGKLGSILALYLPGALKHTDTLQWRELPLIPVAQEIRHVKLKTDDLPVIKKNGKYESEEEYLNTYFRLLREECFHKLKKGITNFVNDQSRLDQRDMMLYRISLQGVYTHHENAPCSLSIGLKYRMESQGSIDYESSPWLKFGNLLCISLDATFREPVWALVEKHISDQSIVYVTLCKEKADMFKTAAQLITELQEMTDRNEEVYMAESQTFYVSFGPAMDVLQHKDCVPFKECLVDACKSMEPASYIEKIDSPPDWGIIFEKDSLSGLISYDEGQPYSLLKDFSALKFGKAVPKLDDTQLDAVELTLKHKLALIQGPPGTGKSFVGVNIVNLLISMNVPQNYGPILVVTYKNFALDHFLEGCLEKLSHGIKVVRTGTPAPGSSEKLKKCTVHEVGRSQWTNQRYNQKRSLTGKLWAMQPDVSRAYMELKRTAIFDANMFLKEATDDHVRFLLRGADVEFAQVESLLQKRRSSERQLKELVEGALTKWLPSQQDLDKFAGKEQKPMMQHERTRGSPVKSPETSPAGSVKKGVQKDTEDPSDSREPSSEERERLLAVDEEPSDEDGGGGGEIDNSSSQQSNLKPFERKLLLLSSKGFELARDLLDMPNVWDLFTDERIRLVYLLQRDAHKKASEEFQRVTEEYVKIHQKLQELNNVHKIDVMRKCDVIGMTVTGAAMRANLLADIRPSVMIVEEAAEILEGQLVAVIPPSVQHLIMIGDHKQLKPMVHFDRLRRHHNLDLSMFERLINCNMPYKQLGKQCRMIDKIAELLRQLKIYERLETNFQLVKQYSPPECVDKPMYFWTHTRHETKSKDSHSMKNSHEAREIKAVAERFCDQGRVSPSKITVLCSYRGQVEEIRTEFKSSKVEAVHDIAVTTIDSFQGQENDIILISLVRSNKEGVIGYLKSMNRLCVAISRAHCGLYLFGNHTHLARASSKGWKVVRDAMRKECCLGSRFPFSSKEAHLPRSDTGSHPDRKSPSREQSTSNTCNVSINVSVGKDATVTHHSWTGISQQDVVPADDTVRLCPAPPGKTAKIPVQDPQTPVPKSPVDNASISPQPFKFEPLDKEARKPTQETKDEERTTEGFKQEPVQETENPKDIISTTQQGSQAFSESDFEEFTKERPVQETEESCAKNDEKKPEIEEGQESCDGQDFKEFEKEKPLQETVNSTKEEIGNGKRDEDTFTNGKRDLEEREVEESLKAHPLQETEGSSKNKRCEMKTFPVQEEAGIHSGMDKHADPQSRKCQQTSLQSGQDRDSGQPSERGVFEEFSANKPLQETESAGEPKGTTSRELRRGGIVEKDSQEREGKPVQESESPRKGNDDKTKTLALLQEKELEEFCKAATSPTKTTAPHK